MSDSNTFWVTGYLPNGVKVSFTIALNSLADACKESTAFTDQLLAQGFRISETGLDTGEQSYTITHIARRVQPGKDGKPDTPIIDFYHDDLAFSGLKTWLNTPAQIASFEQWSGISLAAVPEYDGTAALKRGERAALDAKYIVALAPGKRVIWKHNPDYTEGSKTEAKRIFVRFDGIAAAAPAPTNSNGNGNGAHGTPWTPEAVNELLKEYAPEVIRGALKIKRQWSEWNKSLEEARADIEKYVRAVEF